MVVEHLQIIFDDKWNNIVFQAFLKHNQSACTTVAVLERMNPLKLHMEIQNILKGLFFNVLENIVYMELLRRGYTVTVGKVSDKEIDFVCEDQGSKLYVQVAYLLASEDTIKREFGVFDRVRDNFPKYVVTLDEFDMSRDWIKHRNIRDFLLAEEWN